MGRPTKLTPELQAHVAEVLEAGNFRRVAAAVVGIDEATLCRWMEKGEQQARGPFREFRQAVIAGAGASQRR